MSTYVDNLTVWNLISLDWLKIKRWKGNLIKQRTAKNVETCCCLAERKPEIQQFRGGEGKGGSTSELETCEKLLPFEPQTHCHGRGWVGGEGWNFRLFTIHQFFFVYMPRCVRNSVMEKALHIFCCNCIDYSYQEKQAVFISLFN